MNFIQLPKFNTNICIGDTVVINEGIGTVIFIKNNELTLSNNGLRWTIYINEIQTFSRKGEL
jgi:preprotein translocase subunit YajC